MEDGFCPEELELWKDSPPLSIGELARRLNATADGERYWALCPVHDDHSPSLNFRKGEHCILLHCFVCVGQMGQREYVQRVCAALGITPQQLRLPEHRTLYEYHAADGTPLFRISRLPGKQFRAWHYDAHGRLVSGLGGAERVLYHLPEVLAAVETGKMVYVCEGEKDANRLRDLGLTATTNPFGASSWEDSYNETLRGAHVVILPDNDAAGHTRAQQVAQSLTGAAASVKVVELPGLAEKGDVSDWLEAGGNQSALVALVEETPEWSPAADVKEGNDPNLLHYGAHDDGNAQAVQARYGDRFRYCDAYGWMVYTGTHWTAEGAKAALGRATMDTLRQLYEASRDLRQLAPIPAWKPSATNMRNAMAILENNLTVCVSEFDQSPDSLNVANGVLDLRTGHLAPHHPGQLFTSCLPIPYDEKADSHLWTEFLCSVVGGGPEVLTYLQQAVGYSLTGHTREEILFYVYGPTRSGKGTFTETLLAICGPQLGVEVNFSTFTREGDNDAQNFALAPLKPARLVVASESSKYEKLNEAKIKLLTGGNAVYCAHKNRPHFSYRPQFKVWLVSNHDVKADPDDDAAWGRIVRVEFPTSFKGREDKTLKQRMLSPEHLRGVLAWAVEGAKRWYASASAHGLQAPAVLVEGIHDVRKEQDLVQQWLDEDTERDEWWTPNETVYASYAAWCDANGYKPLSPTNLGRSLSQKGFAAKMRGKVRGKQGLRIHGHVADTSIEVSAVSPEVSVL